MIALLLVGMVLLTIGAEGLVRGSTAIALRIGITPLVIALTVVALGTSSPELVVSIEAAVAGETGLTLGNILGSNVTNIGLLLGVTALIRPMRVSRVLVRREMPQLVTATFLLILLMYDGSLGRADGVVLFASAIAYLYFSYASTRNANKGERDLVDALDAAPGKPFWLDFLFVAAGLAALIVGARFMISGATSLATSFGISEVVIGLTVVAIGTSLPELATCVIAAIRGADDIAFGNVIGSNVLNILFILGLSSIIHPLPITGLRSVDFAALVGSVFLLWLLLSRGGMLKRWEGGLLLAGYGWYMTTMI